jgi:hypothetical protein
LSSPLVGGCFMPGLGIGGNGNVNQRECLRGGTGYYNGFRMNRRGVGLDERLPRN